MSLAHFGPGLLALGLAALAGGLYLAQRLRVRHRRLPVVTGLFWDEAREDSRARVLVRRFRHPWAYALILAICGLVWFAAAGPRTRDEAAPRWVLHLDASGAMLDGDALARALASLRADLAEIPAAHREVIVDDGEPRRLLAPGEAGRLVESRLAGLTAVAAPSRLAEVADALGREAAAGRTIRLLVYGRARLDPRRIRDLPGSFELHHRGSVGDEAELRRPAIANIGAAPSRSEAWDRVDLLVEASARPDLSLDGEALDLVAEETPGVWFARDLPARGGRVEARLEGAMTASYVLPRRRALAVRLAPDAPPPFAQIIAFDPGLELAEQEADLSLGFGERDAARPGLRIADLGDERALTLAGPGATALAAEMSSLLAEHAGGERGRLRVVADETGAGAESRDAVLDAGLVRGENTLEETAALPILVSRTLRWLAGERDFARFARAGEAIPALPPATWVDEAGRRRPSFGGAFVPRRAGDYRADDALGSRVAVSLGPAEELGLEDGRSAAARGGEALALPGSEVDWIALCVLIALVLLGLEWVLVQRGRMP